MDWTMQCYLSCNPDFWIVAFDDAECTLSSITSTNTQTKHHPIAMQRLHILLNERRFFELREELASAEIAGEISEFCALTGQAILAVVEKSGFANDYLEMAEAVASSPYELTIIAESLAIYDSPQEKPSTAAERCLAILDRIFRLRALEQPVDHAVPPAPDGND